MFLKKRKKDYDPYIEHRSVITRIVDNVSNSTFDVGIEDNKNGGIIKFSEKEGNLKAYIKYTYGNSSSGYSKVVTVIKDGQENNIIMDAKFLSSNSEYLTLDQKEALNTIIYNEIQTAIQMLDNDYIQLDCIK